MARRKVTPERAYEPKALGFPVTIMVRVRPAVRELQRIAKVAQEIPQIVECYRMTGDDCYYFTVHLRSADDLEPILDRFTPYGQTTSSLIQSAPVPRRPLPLGPRGVDTKGSAGPGRRSPGRRRRPPWVHRSGCVRSRASWWPVEGRTVDYVRLGRSGLKVSRICLGMMSYGNRTRRGWHLDEDAAEPIVRRAVEAGVTFFDTADMYDLGASEEVTGRLLGRLFARRDDYVLATKIYYPMGPGPNDGGLSRKHILAGIDGSLRRLGTDHVDLYQIHRWDYDTPIDETMQALHDVVRAGKARYIGASSMFARQFAEAQHVAERHGWTPFAAMQNHYNLVYREEEREMIPLCLDQGVGVIPYSPLARGLLAGSRERGGRPQTVRSGNDPLADERYDEADFDVVDVVRAVARERGVAPAQIALAWLLGRHGVTAPIVGATKVAHLDDAVATVGLELSEEETARLEAPYRPHRMIGHY